MADDMTQTHSINLAISHETHKFMVGGADHVIDSLVWEMNQAGYLTEKAALGEDEWSPELYAMISQAANKIVTATLKTFQIGVNEKLDGEIHSL